VQLESQAQQLESTIVEQQYFLAMELTCKRGRAWPVFRVVAVAFPARVVEQPESEYDLGVAARLSREVETRRRDGKPVGFAMYLRVAVP
jgi:hypothetical protein